MNKTIAITGASGFIGSHLKNYLLEKGYTVIAFQRENENNDPGVRSFNLEHGETIMTPLLKNIDVIIHCAFAKEQNKDGLDVNVTGTQSMLEAAKKAGVKKIIFFSSTSAHQNASSFYGKSKLKVEKFFREEKDVVLKCGLVIGNGGLFRQMLLHALNKKIIPVLDGGGQPVQFISIDSVAGAINHILETDTCGIHVLAQPQPLSYKELFLTIKKFFKIKLLFVPAPFSLLKLILSVTEKLNIQLPVTKENLHGLKAMKAWKNEQDAKTLQLPNEKFEDLLKRYFSKL